MTENQEEIEQIRERHERSALRCPAWKVGDSRAFDAATRHTRDSGLGAESSDTQSGAITGRANVSTGAFGIADKTPRFNNVYRVLRPDEPAVCVTGGATPGSGGISVADPRPERDNSGFWIDSDELGPQEADSPDPTKRIALALIRLAYAVAEKVKPRP